MPCWSRTGWARPCWTHGPLQPKPVPARTPWWTATVSTASWHISLRERLNIKFCRFCLHILKVALFVSPAGVLLEASILRVGETRTSSGSHKIPVSPSVLMPSVLIEDYRRDKSTPSACPHHIQESCVLEITGKCVFVEMYIFFFQNLMNRNVSISGLKQIVKRYFH